MESWLNYLSCTVAREGTAGINGLTSLRSFINKLLNIKFLLFFCTGSLFAVQKYLKEDYFELLWNQIEQPMVIRD